MPSARSSIRCWAAAMAATVSNQQVLINSAPPQSSSASAAVTAAYGYGVTVTAAAGCSASAASSRARRRADGPRCRDERPLRRLRLWQGPGRPDLEVQEPTIAVTSSTSTSTARSRPTATATVTRRTAITTTIIRSTATAATEPLPFVTTDAPGLESSGAFRFECAQLYSSALALYPPAMTVQPTESILIVDFGSQVTQLIARRVREAGVYSRDRARSTLPKKRFSGCSRKA